MNSLMISLCVLSVAPALQVPLIFSPNHPFLCTSLEFSCLPLLQVSSVQVLGWHLGLGIFTLTLSIPHPFLLEITSQCLGHVACMLHSDPCSQDPESNCHIFPSFPWSCLCHCAWLVWSAEIILHHFGCIDSLSSLYHCFSFVKDFSL